MSILIRQGNPSDVDRVATLHALSQLAACGPFLNPSARQAVPTETREFWKDWFDSIPGGVGESCWWLRT